MNPALALANQDRLWPWGLFGAVLAMASLPVYIHAPKFFVDHYGVGLAAMGGVLALLRLVDVVQDPLLGWLAAVTAPRRMLWVMGAAVLMALGMLGLFALPAPMPPLVWFAATLAVVFSAWSFLTICFYADGVTRAATIGPQGHLRLAGWREGGALAGVCLAAVAPTLLTGISAAPMAAYAAGFAALTVFATSAMMTEWPVSKPAQSKGLAMFRPALRDPLARRLLVLALVNAAPVAVTSTLFLFFVESRLAAPGTEGALLLLFFLSAALSTPVWTRLAARYGAKPVLLVAMGMAVIAFLGTLTLGAGDLWAFALICVVTGAALGADNTLLPAIFARRLADLGEQAAAFGLWAFVSKLSLALAAAVLLPALQAAGFVSGLTNGATALTVLTLLYAGLPCILKLFALFLLALTDVPEV